MIPTVLGEPNHISKLSDFETVAKAEQNQQIVFKSVSLLAAENGQKKTAAPMAVGNGGTSSQEKASSEESSYQTPADDAIKTAALWLAAHREECKTAIIPFVRKRFSLTILEAIEALQLGHKLQQGGLR